MSILSALFEQSKIYNFEQAFGVKDITTPAMQAAIRDWARLYYQTEPTRDEDPCQRIPAAVVSKLTKTVFSEYEARPAQDGNEYISTVLTALDAIKGKAMQQALIGGQCYLKPFFFSSLTSRKYPAIMISCQPSPLMSPAARFP